MEFSCLYWCLLVLLSVSQCNWVRAAAQSPLIGPHEEVACPDADDIFPCVCTHAVDGFLDMNCSSVTSEDELAGVFQANFPTAAFRRLTIFGNSHLQVLKSDALGSATFQEFWITDGILELVEDNALIGSSSTAIHMVFNFNMLVLFPFSDLQFFTQLKSLDLRHNDLSGFPEVASTTLQVLYLSHNPLSSLPVTAFTNTPALVDIHLSNCGIPELTPGRGHLSKNV